jgi:hypothetical protein
MDLFKSRFSKKAFPFAGIRALPRGMAHRWIATPGCVKLHAGGTMLEKVSNDNEFSMALSGVPPAHPSFSLQLLQRAALTNQFLIHAEGLDKDRTHTITVTYTGDCSYFGIGVAVRRAVEEYPSASLHSLLFFPFMQKRQPTSTPLTSAPAARAPISFC